MAGLEKYSPEEILQVGEAVLEYVGKVTLQHEAALQQISERGESKAAFGLFINPEIALDAYTQLAFMDSVWNLLGHKIPEFSGPQLDVLDSVAQAHPNLRIVPTPLLDFPGRQRIAHNARKLPGQEFDPIESALRLPDDGTIYRELATDLSGRVERDDVAYVVRYKSPHTKGAILSLESYQDELLEAGQAILQDDTFWTFPIMDVQVNAPRVAEEAGQLYERINPIATPESLIVTQLLHQGANTPNQTGAIDFANEAVYMELEEGVVEEPSFISTVQWVTNWSRIGTYARQFSGARDYMGVREASSAL